MGFDPRGGGEGGGEPVLAEAPEVNFNLSGIGGKVLKKTGSPKAEKGPGLREEMGNGGTHRRAPRFIVKREMSQQVKSQTGRQNETQGGNFPATPVGSFES